MLDDFEDPLSLRSRHATVTVNGRTYETHFDAQTRRLDTTSPEGRRAFSLHDAVGRVVEAGGLGLAPLRVAYDAEGRLRRVAQGSGAEERVSTFEYDANGWLRATLDPSGRTTTFHRDAAGRVVRQDLPDGRSIQLTYDAAGNLTSVRPAGKSPHAFTFTPVDLAATYAPPPLSPSPEPATTYTYDRDRRPTSIARSGGRQVNFGWSTSGRLESLDTSRGRIAYTYSTETSSQVTRISAPGGVDLSFGYDGFLPIRSTWTGPVSGTVEPEYDSDFRISTLRIEGVGIPYGYDGDSLLVQAGSLAIQRDPVSGLPVGTTLGSVSTTAAYDAFGELAEATSSVAGAPVFSTTYTRDTLGRIRRQRETVGASTSTYDYRYDEAGRLAEVTRDGLPVSALTYDSNSNRLGRLTPQGTVAATYDAQDRLLTDGDREYAYGADGELKTKSQNGQTVTYDYDELGNLRRVEREDGIVVDYLIDGMNRRVGKRVQGVLVQGFLYHGALSPVAELDASGAVVSRFIYGSRPNVPDYLQKGGRTYRILSDHLGSPRLVVDTADGTFAQRLDYDEWGKVTLDTNPGFQPFGFAGGLYDRHTGLLRFGARDYDPETGRWTAKDPIGFAGGNTNLYLYIGADPVNRIDPTGLFDFADLPNVPQSVNDFSAGFGDGILATLTAGFVRGESLRKDLGIGGVNPCSGGYLAGRVTGTTATLAAYAAGAIPGTLTHFTTVAGAEGIAATGAIMPSTGLTLFGEGVYATAGSSLFVPAASAIPVTVAGSGFLRIVPNAVFLNGGSPLTGAWFGAYGAAANADIAEGPCSCD